MNKGVLITFVLLLIAIMVVTTMLCIYYPRYSNLKNRYCKLLPCNNNPWRIPKIIYRIYAYGSGKKLPHQFQKAWDMTAKHNPEFKQVLFDDKDCENFLRQHYPGKVYDAYHKINPKYGAAKADLFRYALMYKMGGIYLDIKSFAKRLCRLVSPDDGYVLSNWSFPQEIAACKNTFGEFQMWYIICVPRHPFLKAVIDQVVDNINNDHGSFGKYGVLKLTGPVVYTNVITKEMKKNDDYRIVCPNGNNVLIPFYGHKRKHHTSVKKTHFTKLKEPIVLHNK